MPIANVYRALRRPAVHSMPQFDGPKSRHHHNVALWKLRALAFAHALRSSARLKSVETFVQFAGFPRSGHSLIGSILDAHPQARVSHELDTMGLLKKGFSQAAIFALIDEKSTEFTRHGRCWNGHSYLVPGGRHLDASGLRVLGDKKGDAAVRWIARDPSLLGKLNDEGHITKKWILVLRNPFDNIATMSLRKGRVYDDLRTSTRNPQEFQRELKKKQDDGVIASEALDSQIDEYAALCHTVEQIKQATRANDWFDLCHEELSVRPRLVIEAMLSFLGLSIDNEYIDNCASLVKKSPNRSRHQLQWSAAKRARVSALIHQFSFLKPYEKDDGV